MEQLEKYIVDILGIEIEVKKIQKSDLRNLPLFLSETYLFYNISLFKKELILIEPKDIEALSIIQIDKHIELLKESLLKPVILLMDEIMAVKRKRLIERGVNFIVPGKQLYLPELLIDLRESYDKSNRKRKKEALLPSAQFLLIFHLLNKEKTHGIERLSFKEIAQKLNYTPMGVTKAINNLLYHELVEIEGIKEKYIHFELRKAELWKEAEERNILVNPVIRRVFVDKMPEGAFFLYSNESALPEYSNMNPSRQEFFAVERDQFYALSNNRKLINANVQEGKYCLEVWKYNPVKLVDELYNDMPVVDPLSLYLSLKDIMDERIEMALEQIKEKYIWSLD